MSHLTAIYWHDNDSSSRITWTFCCCADKNCATMMQHLVGKMKWFPLTPSLVIKAKMKLLKNTLLLLQHHRSWTVGYYYCWNLFQVCQKLLFCERHTPHYSNCHTALVPVKFDQIRSSQNNLTAGRNTSLVGWRYAVLNITESLHDFLHRQEWSLRMNHCSSMKKKITVIAVTSFTLFKQCLPLRNQVQCWFSDTDGLVSSKNNGKCSEEKSTSLYAESGRKGKSMP